MRWVRPGLPELASRLLGEALEACCLKAGAARGWVLLPAGPSGTYDLIACLGTAAPTRRRLPGTLPDSPRELSSRELNGLCPFPNPQPSHVIPLGRGAMLLEGPHPPSARLVEQVSLCLQRIEVEREAEALRLRVQRLSEELQQATRARSRLNPDLESTQRRTEALSSWHRAAATMLATPHLTNALPSLAERAASVLDHRFSAIMLLENRRVRVYGGETLVRRLGPAFPARQLGSIGRRVLRDGVFFISSRDPGRLARSHLFARMGLNSVLAVPLELEGKIHGMLLLGDPAHRVYQPEELDMARLMAHQVALILENAMLVSTADLERVVARAVLDSMADGVYTLDWEKRITSFNPAAEAITGWPADQAIGRTCAEVLCSQYVSQGPRGERVHQSCHEGCPMLQLLANQKLMDTGLTVEGTINTRSGEVRYVSSTYSVVVDRGDLLGAVVIFRDITIKKAIEQMKSDYAAALSHDLKTPLTAMKGYAITLLRHGEKLDEAARHEALEIINSEIDRVTRMFDNLLHQARHEAGQHTVHLESVPVEPAVRKVINLHQVGSRKHQLRYELPPGLAVRADADQLDQVLTNLISNAIKYSPAGGEVLVRGELDGGYALLWVCDNGPGIPRDKHAQVFERFRRLEDRKNWKVQGSGLGLYITRTLVEGMGGQVGLESAEGQGSRFWIRLPQAREAGLDEELTPSVPERSS
ncbi:MAG: ATP-binding protein [Candidatus Eremiobacterota bacterium]